MRNQIGWLLLLSILLLSVPAINAAEQDQSPSKRLIL